MTPWSDSSQCPVHNLATYDQFRRRDRWLRYDDNIHWSCYQISINRLGGSGRVLITCRKGNAATNVVEHICKLHMYSHPNVVNDFVPNRVSVYMQGIHERKSLESYVAIVMILIIVITLINDCHRKSEYNKHVLNGHERGTYYNKLF